MAKKGLVYLIGAGPGDPGLITVKGLECLRRADTVIYDYLANASLLAEAQPDAEVIYVGKSAGQHALPQEKINQLLVTKAKEGKIVARLKGGDPFLFGRGGEEAEELANAGLTFEVVPGITSAIAAPAYAGIPVTHRDFTSTFAAVTGHEDPTKTLSSIDWARISTGIGTLVFLMGVANLPSIVEQLILHGRPAETPAAVVRWGTRSSQQTVTGTLDDIVERVRRAGLKAPSVIIVGEVVRLREKLQWFDNRPLFGKRVLVTRSREQASVLSELLRAHGAEPVEFPTIEIVPPADFGPLDEAIARLATYAWAIFTSANGVKIFVDRLRNAGLDIRALKGVKLAAIGPATAHELERYGLLLDYVPVEYVAESIVEGLKGQVRGKRVLLARAEIARQVLPEGLKKEGASVDQVVAYRTISSADGKVDVKRMLLEKEIDVITFTSSSTVENFVAKLEGLDLEAATDGVTIASIGPITSETALARGLRVDVTAQDHTIPGLVEAIVQHVSPKA